MSSPTDFAGQPPRAARLLETALLLTILAHGAAMASMALILLPGMPGGGSLPADRVAYIASNPTLWRIGWLPWHLTALSDLFLAVALLRTAWIPRRLALLVLVITVIALLIEQTGEIAWISEGVSLAGSAAQSGVVADYLQFESRTYLQVAGVAALFYTVAALGWTACFIGAKVWSRALTWLSPITWGVLLLVSIAPLLPAGMRPDDAIIAAGNAVGFAFLMLWLCLIAELVLRRARPDAPHGRMAQWRFPHRDLIGRLFDLIANSRLARAFGEWLPSVAFVSDITDVIYANYLVEAERLAPYVPWGMELQTLGQDGKYALFSHLTYQHGHFGPKLLGGLRRLMPSPVQSNWRIYVRDPQTDLHGIYFVTSAIDHPLVAVMARLLSEGVPMHVSARAEVTAVADGSFRVRLDPGMGSAPDLAMHLQPAPVPTFTGHWRDCFENFHDLLAYSVPQDRAMSSQTWYRRVTRQEIALGIPLDICQPLTGEGESKAARAIVGDALPICFRIPRVTLRFSRELHDVRASG